MLGQASSIAVAGEQEMRRLAREMGKVIFLPGEESDMLQRSNLWS